MNEAFKFFTFAFSVYWQAKVSWVRIIDRRIVVALVKGLSGGRFFWRIAQRFLLTSYKAQVCDKVH